MGFPEIQLDHTDALARAFSRLLLQFRRSPVLIDILMALVAEVQELIDATEQVILGRTVAGGVGEQLNALGRIVGQDRNVTTYDDSVWFVPDVNSVDTAREWVEGGLYLGQYQADDAEFKSLIEARVYRNFSKYGSVPEIQRAFKAAYGYDISFVPSAPMEVDVILADSVGDAALAAVIGQVWNDQVDAQYRLPIPATVRISGVTRYTTYPTVLVVDDGTGTSEYFLTNTGEQVILVNPEISSGSFAVQDVQFANVNWPFADL